MNNKVELDNGNVVLYLGNCLDVLPIISDKSIDAIIADIPYGTTACKWDTVISFDDMWKQLKRIIKPKGAIALFGSQPFTSALIMSNPKWFRYQWIWNKRKAANFLFGNKQPLKLTEDVNIFYKNQPTYNAIKRINPNGLEKPGRVGIGNTIREHLPNCPKQSKAGKYYEPNKLLPTNILEFSKPLKPIHPTQKPVALMEYLIKTYTDENETVLDFTMGSGTTGIAAINTKRNFIGIEKEEKYFNITVERCKEALLNGT